MAKAVKNAMMATVSGRLWVVTRPPENSEQRIAS